MKASLLSQIFFLFPHGAPKLYTTLAHGKFSVPSSLSLSSAGSVYRDEFDLAILKMQEDNRLEILKRKWWDGGKCPKEEDHRAKGPSTLTSPALSTFSVQPLTPPSPRPFTTRSGHGEHWRHLRGPGVWPPGGHLHGGAGVCLDVAADAGERGERGLPNLYLLCLALPSMAPRSPRGRQAPPFSALRRRCGMASFCARHHQHKLKANTSVLPHARPAHALSVAAECADSRNQRSVL